MIVAIGFGSALPAGHCCSPVPRAWQAPFTGGGGKLATWTIDPAHSTAEFSVKHMMISTVKGRFGVISGALQFDGADLTTASVEATGPGISRLFSACFRRLAGT